jgi:phage gp46-like protein
MADVLLYQTPDGGEIDFVNGQAVMSQDGLSTAVFLSLFGGNEDDGGSQSDDPVQWWGNLGETDPSRRYRGATQKLLRELPAIPMNIARFTDSVESDLAWMLESVADSVTVEVTLPALNTVMIVITILIDQNQFKFEFRRPTAAT